MLTEEQIAELMRSIERPHTLRTDERARIQRALEEFDPADAGDEASGVEPIDPATAPAPVIELSTSSGVGGPPRRRVPAMLVAAVVALVIGVTLTIMQAGDDTPVRTADQPDSATVEPADRDASTLAAGVAFCSGPFSDLAAAIAGWDGITNWSFLTDPRNPEPHLPTRTYEMLDALEALVDDPGLDRARSELDAALADADQAAGFTPEIRSRAAEALTSVVDSVRAVIESDRVGGSQRFATCDLSSFSAEG